MEFHSVGIFREEGGPDRDGGREGEKEKEGEIHGME